MLKGLSKTQKLQIWLILTPTTCTLAPLCAALAFGFFYKLLTAQNLQPLAMLFIGLFLGLLVLAFFGLPLAGLYALWQAVLTPPEKWLERTRLFNFLAFFGIAAIPATAYFIYALAEGSLGVKSLKDVGVFAILIYLMAAPLTLGCIKLKQYVRLRLATKSS